MTHRARDGADHHRDAALHQRDEDGHVDVVAAAAAEQVLVEEDGRYGDDPVAEHDRHDPSDVHRVGFVAALSHYVRVALYGRARSRSIRTRRTYQCEATKTEDEHCYS